MSIPTGWQCPLCGKIHAPWVSTCECKSVPNIYKPVEIPPGYVEPSRTIEEFPRDGTPKVIC